MEIEKLSLEDLILEFANEEKLLNIIKEDIFQSTRYEFSFSRDEAVSIMQRLAENFSKSRKYGILRSRVQIDDKSWYIEFGYKTMSEQAAELKPAITSEPETLNYFATAYFVEQRLGNGKVNLVIDYLREPEKEAAILNLMRIIYSAHKKIKIPLEI